MNRTKMHFVYLFFVLFYGCSSFNFRTFGQEEQLLALVDPTKITTNAQTVLVEKKNDIEKIDERSNNINNITLKGSVNIVTTGKEFSLDATLISDKENTRVRIDYGGLATIVDFAITKMGGTMFLPRKDIAFKGDNTSFKQSKSWAGIIANDLSRMKILFPDTDEENATGKRYNKTTSTMVVYKKENDTLLILKKIIFTTIESELVISKIFKYDSNGDLCGKIFYEDYQRTEGRLIPNKVIVCPNADIKLIFMFKEIMTNKEIKNDKFILKIPEKNADDNDIPILNIDEFEKKNWLTP